MRFMAYEGGSAIKLGGDEACQEGEVGVKAMVERESMDLERSGIGKGRS